MSIEEGIVACEAMMEKVDQFPGRVGEFPAVLAPAASRNSRTCRPHREVGRLRGATCEAKLRFRGRGGHGSTCRGVSRSRSGLE